MVLCPWTYTRIRKGRPCGETGVNPFPSIELQFIAESFGSYTDVAKKVEHNKKGNNAEVTIVNEYNIRTIRNVRILELVYINTNGGKLDRPI